MYSVSRALAITYAASEFLHSAMDRLDFRPGMWHLPCIGNFIAPRINWSVRRGSVGTKTCHRLFIQSSGGGDTEVQLAVLGSLTMQAVQILISFLLFVATALAHESVPARS